MINILINTDTTGENTDADNQRFIAAVKSSVETEFPNEIVSVEMTDDSGSISPHSDEIELIIRNVWEKADYY